MEMDGKRTTIQSNTDVFDYYKDINAYKKRQNKS